MRKQFTSKQEIDDMLRNYCKVNFVDKKTEAEKNVFERKFGIISIDNYLPTTEDKVRAIKSMGYNLDNFRNDPHFDQDFIKIYDEI